MGKASVHKDLVHAVKGYCPIGRGQPPVGEGELQVVRFAGWLRGRFGLLP